MQVIAEITHACPCKCRFCTIRKNASLMRLSDFEKALKLFQEVGADKAVISGGEPSIVSNLDYYVFLAKRLGYTVTVATNGYYPQRVLEATPDAIQVSIDYYGERHDQLRGVHGLFENAWKLVKKAHLREPAPEVMIRTTLLGDNFKDILHIRRRLDEEGMEDVPILVMPVRGAGIKIDQQLLVKISQTDGILIADSCPAGKESFVITPEMDVLACIFYRKKLGKLRNFDHEELQEILENGESIPRFACEA